MSARTENTYVARQTIVGTNRNTMGYELLFRDGSENAYPNIPLDEATSRLIVESHLDLGIDKLVGSHKAFINFTEKSLIEKFPLVFDKDKIVVEVLESVNPSEEIVDACRELVDEGYTLALDDHDFSDKWDHVPELIDIIKIDIAHIKRDELGERLKNLNFTDKTLIAERVETHEQFAYCKEMGFDYFQGYFFSKPEVLQKKKIPGNKMMTMELLGESAKDPMQFDSISEIISHDVGLSVKLLKFINSAAFGVRGITSLNHALTYLGEAEVKKFISLVAMAAIGDDKPPELIALAAVRARFCELLAQEIKHKDLSGSAFLCGLFSLIEAVMNDTLESIFLKLPIDGSIKQALRGVEGSEAGDLLKLVLAYEQGDWLLVSELSNSLDIDEGAISNSYREAICWARSFETAMKQSS
ncbi:MAG: HDOD domain-containing protein [Pseudomonadales bacterium]|nr:HDOD domain-containing protein [Pseudomonadales bacterium]